MAEDPPPPPSNDPKTNPAGQSAVARLLLASSMLEQESCHQGPLSNQIQDRSRTPNYGSGSNRLHGQSCPNGQGERILQAEQDGRAESPEMNGISQNDLSPDVYITYPPSSSGLKALKCPMCDYMTSDKSNFRRHKRLHMRNKPATVLRCGKCEFSTILPRKIREHYIQDHGEDYGPPTMPAMQEAAALRFQAYSDNHFGGRQMEIPHNQCTQTSIPVTGTIHTLLGAAPPTMQFTRGEPQILANCVTQYRPYEVPTQRVSQDNHMASDYLRSIVSNIITTHHAPRVPATSTLTSSSFYLPTSVNSSQGLHPLTQRTLSRPPHCEESSGEEVKVKMEPLDCDGGSDVSSSATPVCSSGPCHMEAETTQSLSLEASDALPPGGRSNEATPSVEPSISNVHSSEAASSQNEVRSTVENHRTRSVDDCDRVEPRPQRPAADSQDVRSSVERQDLRVVGTGSISSNLGDVNSAIDSRDQRTMVNPLITRPGPDIAHSNVTVKTEMSNIGVQCALPYIKREGADRRCTRTFLVERSVQCELLSPRRRLSSTPVVSDSSEGDQTRSRSKCAHCGVTFEDEVLFSIHIGCHSHTDPFVCNVCGKQCYNKYGFYSHIMRGHQM